MVMTNKWFKVLQAHILFFHEKRAMIFQKYVRKLYSYTKTVY